MRQQEPGWSRAFRKMAAFLKSGAPPEEAAAAVSLGLDDDAVAKALRRVADAVRHGTGLAAALQELARDLPPDCIRAIASAETEGSLAAGCLTAADLVSGKASDSKTPPTP